MFRNSPFSISAVLAPLLVSATLQSTLRADVSIVNQSRETLFVATGETLKGKLVYGGWTRIDDGASAKVYVGSQEKIMLCVVSLRANGPHVWEIGNSFTRDQLVATTEGFRCEQVGGALHEWQFTNLTQDKVWRKDDTHPWPSDENLFLATFFVVRGNQDQRFIP